MNDKIKDAVNLSKLHLVMCVPSLSDFANNHLFQANCKAISCHVFGLTLLIALALTRQSEVSDSIALSRKLCLEIFYLHTAPCLFPSLPTLTCMCKWSRQALGVSLTWFYLISPYKIHTRISHCRE